jgi:hypothetical protein
MSSNSIIKFTFSHKALIYNLGALSSYASQICFLTHAITLLITRSKPHPSLVSFAIFSFASILLMSPYKWDRKWMRYKSEVGMVTFSSVIFIYTLCWFLN